MCSIVKEKNRVSCATGVRWVRCFRFVSACAFVDYGDGGGGRRCVFRAADGKLATLRTGSTVMRCLGGRNIDPVGPQRTSCATLQRLTTKNPSSTKKKKHLGIYHVPNKMHHRRHGGGGDFFTHKRREPLGRRPRRILGFVISLFSATYDRSKIYSSWFSPVCYDFVRVGAWRVRWYRVIRHNEHLIWYNI